SRRTIWELPARGIRQHGFRESSPRPVCRHAWRTDPRGRSQLRLRGRVASNVDLCENARQFCDPRVSRASKAAELTMKFIPIIDHSASRYQCVAVALALLACLASGAARAENWPRWRGPGGN